MTLELDKSGWKRVVLGDVARHITDRVDAETSGLERFVAGEHIRSQDLQIRSWGIIGRDPIGPMFYKRFKPGHVLYVSRRSYLRKTAVPGFEGICGEKTFVLETKDPNQFLQQFLPFVLSAERFHEYAVRMSRGSVNPYINWTDLAAYEFDLPSCDEQRRLSDLLWAVEGHRQSITTEFDQALAVRVAHLHDRMSDIAAEAGTVTLHSLVESGRPITYGILMPGSGFKGGVPVVKVKDFPDGRIRQEKLLLTNPELAHEYRRSTLKPGDLLISIRGTVGRLAEVPESLDGANITQDTARLSIAPEHNRQYVRLALESDFVQSQIRRQITGLAVKGLNLGALREITIPVPTDRTVEERLVNESVAISGSVAMLDASRATTIELSKALSVEVFGGMR
jgi:type I restriction enzyme, S subunit